MKEMVFICFTPYQLLVSMYYAYKIKGIKRTLIFKDFANYNIDSSFYEKHFDKIFIIPYYEKKNIFAKQFYKSYYGGYLFRFSPLYKYLKDINNSVVMYFSDQEVSSNKMIRILNSGNNNTIILTEEGISIYAYHKSNSSLKTKIGNLLCGLKTCNVIGDSKLYNIIFAKNKEKVHPRFDKDFIIQQSNLFFDKEFIKNIDICVDNVQNNLKKKLMILGEPISEASLDVKKYTNTLEEIMNFFNDDYDIYIKPHPRENDEVYKSFDNCTLLYDLKWVPVELIVSKFNFEIVISISSSSAVNIAMINNKIQILLIYKLYGLNINENLIRLFGQYDNIYTLERLDDFNHIIVNNIRHNDVCTFDDLKFVEDKINIID